MMKLNKIDKLVCKIYRAIYTIPARIFFSDENMFCGVLHCLLQDYATFLIIMVITVSIHSEDLLHFDVTLIASNSMFNKTFV